MRRHAEVTSASRRVFALCEPEGESGPASVRRAVPLVDQSLKDRRHLLIEHCALSPDQTVRHPNQPGSRESE